MKKQNLDQIKEPVPVNSNVERFNNWLDGLTIKEYSYAVPLLKQKLGWSDQVFSQKRKAKSFKKSEEIAIESIIQLNIFI